MADPDSTPAADPAVRLRPWQAADAAALAAAWNDPDVAAGSQPPDDRSVGAAERWIAGCTVREHRLLAIDRVIDIDGRCVGEVGLANIDQQRGAALIGWWVGPDHRGKGYATAGVHAMVELAFSEFGLRAIVAEVGIENAPSIRVAERAGLALLRPGSPERPHAYVARHGGSSE